MLSDGFSSWWALAFLIPILFASSEQPVSASTSESFSPQDAPCSLCWPSASLAQLPTPWGRTFLCSKEANMENQLASAVSFWSPKGSFPWDCDKHILCMEYIYSSELQAYPALLTAKHCSFMVPAFSLPFSMVSARSNKISLLISSWLACIMKLPSISSRNLLASLKLCQLPLSHSNLPFISPWLHKHAHTHTKKNLMSFCPSAAKQDWILLPSKADKPALMNSA